MTLSPRNTQQQSLLFRQPREIRDLIYKSLFTSTTFNRSERTTARISSVQIRPDFHGLAFLRSCQVAHEEIGDSWLGQVLFDFEESKTMLDTLVPLSRELIGKIRRMRVSTTPLMLSTLEDDTFYRVPAAIRFLAGLQLDVLHIHDDIFTRVPEIAYKTIDDLVRAGDGWKELQFLSKDSKMFVYGVKPYDSGGTHYYRRAPQPTHWQAVLDERDNEADTRPVVTIFRTSSSEDWSSVFDPTQRQEFSQEPATAAEKDSFGLEKDLTLSRPEEEGKAVLVIVRRGGADYTLKDYRRGGSMQDMRDDFGYESWATIKREFVDRKYFDDDEEDFDDEEFLAMIGNGDDDEEEDFDEEEFFAIQASYLMYRQTKW